LNHPYTELMPTVTALMDALGIESTVLTGAFRREHPDYPYHGDYESASPRSRHFWRNGWEARRRMREAVQAATAS
jgi:hypothetical protein